MTVGSSEILTGAGLPEEEVAIWRRGERVEFGSFPASVRAVSEYLSRGEALVARLPGRPARSEAEAAAAAAIADDLNAARVAFLRGHAEELYSALTGDLTRAVRVDELVYGAAERFPGLVPTRAAVDAEELERQAGRQGGRSRSPRDLLVAHVLASPAAALHLVHAMLRPAARGARAPIESFRATGRGRPRPGAGRAARAGRPARAAQPTPAERRGRRHARPDRGGRGPDPARPRRSRSASCAAGWWTTRATPATHLRRGAEPHAPLPRAALVPVLPHARPRLREQALPRPQRRPSTGRTSPRTPPRSCGSRPWRPTRSAAPASCCT